MHALVIPPATISIDYSIVVVSLLFFFFLIFAHKNIVSTHAMLKARETYRGLFCVFVRGAGRRGLGYISSSRIGPIASLSFSRLQVLVRDF